MNEYMKLNLRHKFVIAALAVGSFALSALAHADQTRYTDGLPAPAFRVETQTAQTYAPYRYAQNKISYAQAKSIALRSRPGSTYVSMRLSGNTYIVRLETSNGRVVDVRVDATTGRVR